MNSGCEFKRANPAAKHKTCTNPTPAAAAAETPPSVFCPEITGATRCKKNAGCVWAREVGQKYKKCAASTEAPTDAPTANTTEFIDSYDFDGSWTVYDGCCRVQFKATQEYSTVTFTGVDAMTADDKCEELCEDDQNCNAYELTTKKANFKRKPLRFKCELFSADNIDSGSRATKSCKKATCSVKTAAPVPA